MSTEPYCFECGAEITFDDFEQCGVCGAPFDHTFEEDEQVPDSYFADVVCPECGSEQVGIYHGEFICADCRATFPMPTLPGAL